MSWRDTETTLGDVPAQPVHLSSDPPSWRDTMRDADEQPDIVEDKPWYHVIQQVPIGAYEEMRNTLGPSGAFVKPGRQNESPGTSLQKMRESIANAGMSPLDQPTDDSERVARQAGRFGENALEFLLPMSIWAKGRAALAAGRTGVEAITPKLRNLLGSVNSGTSSVSAAKAATGAGLDKFATSIAAHPWMTTGMDFGGGLGAGALQEATRQGGGTPEEQFLAGLAGGAGGASATGLTRDVPAMLGRLKNMAAKYVTPEGWTNNAYQKGVKMIGESITPDVIAAEQRARELQSIIPGFKYTLGGAAGDASPSLARTEMGVMNDLEGGDLDKAVQDKMESLRAIRQHADTLFPNQYTSYDVQDAARGAVNQSAEKRAGALSDLQRQQEQSVDKLPEADRFVEGEKLRGRYNELETKASDDLTQQANDLGLNDMRLTGYKGLQSRLQGIADDIPMETNKNSIPGYLKQQLDNFDKFNLSPSGTPYTFQNAKRLREESGRLMRQELNRPNPDVTKAMIYKRMRDSVDDFMVNDAPKDMGDLGPKYQAWRQNYVNDYVKRFEQGGVYKIGRGLAGDYVTENERIADLFFKKGDQTAAKQFAVTFQGDPEAASAMRNSILDEARQAAIKDGVIDPKSISKFVTDHKSILDEFPAVRDELLDVNRSTQSIAERGAALEQRTKDVNRSYLADITKGDPDAVVIRAIKDPTQMRQLALATRDNPDALRRAVWDKVNEWAGVQKGGMPIADRMQEYMKQYSRSMKMVFGDQHLKNISDVIDAYRIAGRLPIPTGKAMSPNAMRDVESTLGQTMPAFMSKLWAVESHRASMKWAALNILRSASYAQSQRSAVVALRDALANPQQALDFANLIKSSGSNNVAARRLNTWLLSNGYETMNQNPQAEEGNDVQHYAEGGRVEPTGSIEPYEPTNLENIKAYLQQLQLPNGTRQGLQGMLDYVPGVAVEDALERSYRRGDAPGLSESAGAALQALPLMGPLGRVASTLPKGIPALMGDETGAMMLKFSKGTKSSGPASGPKRGVYNLPDRNVADNNLSAFDQMSLESRNSTLKELPDEELEYAKSAGPRQKHHLFMQLPYHDGNDYEYIGSFNNRQNARIAADQHYKNEYLEENNEQSDEQLHWNEKGEHSSATTGFPDEPFYHILKTNELTSKKIKLPEDYKEQDYNNRQETINNLKKWAPDVDIDKKYVVVNSIPNTKSRALDEPYTGDEYRVISHHDNLNAAKDAIKDHFKDNNEFLTAQKQSHGFDRLPSLKWDGNSANSGYADDPYYHIFKTEELNKYNPDEHSALRQALEASSAPKNQIQNVNKIMAKDYNAPQTSTDKMLWLKEHIHPDLINEWTKSGKNPLHNWSKEDIETMYEASQPTMKDYD